MELRIINEKLIPKDRKYKWDDSFEDIKHICLIDDSKINIGEAISINGLVYSFNCISQPGGYASAKIINISNGEKRNCVNEITCPYCAHTKSDSWECDDSCEKEDCDICGSVFFYERIVEVSYTSIPVKKCEIKELKC